MTARVSIPVQTSTHFAIARPMFPDYLGISRDNLGRNQPVTVRIKDDMASLAVDMAEAIKQDILNGAKRGRGATLIVPVGPVDQFPILAKMLNAEKISCRDALFINMDEYLSDDDAFIARDHPLSFRGFMDRAFYDLIDSALVPPPENRVFPDPRDPGGIQRVINARGGVDACYGGIGINCHLAFNEPPEPDEACTVEEFAARPTRTLSLSRETRTINAVTVGGDIAVIPQRAITVGMKEILAARRLRFYCNRPWQSGVIRRALHGPLTPACPASYFRLHPDAIVTLADYVAAPPNIQLR